MVAVTVSALNYEGGSGTIILFVATNCKNNKKDDRNVAHTYIHIHNGKHFSTFAKSDTASSPTHSALATNRESVTSFA